MDLLLDIETIPSQSPAVRAEIDAKHAVTDVLPEIRAAANRAAHGEGDVGYG